jgi:phosphatidylglycerol:prolipoprotein diacylglycerol transferase
MLGQIGPFTIFTYTVLLDAAILIGLAALAWRGWRAEGRPAAWLDAGLFALAGGIVAGRLAHVAICWEYFASNAAEIVQVWRGGIDWHGAVLGGLAGLALGCRLRRVSWQQAADVLALALPAGAVLANIGCLMAGCAPGREVATLADFPPLIAAELPDLYGITAPRLNSQLFGIAASALTLGAAWGLARVVRRSGVRLWIVLALLGLAAFAIGYTRGDAVPLVGSLRLDQALDLVVAAVGALGTLAAARGAHRQGLTRRR